MSKPSLDSLVTRKGSAAPAALEPPAIEQASKEPRKEVTKEASKEPSNQGASEGRRRAWHQPGQEEWKKTNYEMPLRVQTKLKEMKNWGYIPNVYKFVAEVVEKEIDKVIAKAEKEGY
jgi:hypothetical protein